MQEINKNQQKIFNKREEERETYTEDILTVARNIIDDADLMHLEVNVDNYIRNRLEEIVETVEIEQTDLLINTYQDYTNINNSTLIIRQNTDEELMRLIDNKPKCFFSLLCNYSDDDSYLLIMKEHNYLSEEDKIIRIETMNEISSLDYILSHKEIADDFYSYLIDNCDKFKFLSEISFLIQNKFEIEDKIQFILETEQEELEREALEDAQENDDDCDEDFEDEEKDINE